MEKEVLLGILSFISAIFSAIIRKVNTKLALGIFLFAVVLAVAALVSYFYSPSPKEGSAMSVQTSLPVAPFGDVANDAYYYKAVEWAREQGIAKGKEEGMFCPQDPCSRIEAITLLWRANGSHVSASENIPYSDVTANQASAVRWATEKGITNGISKRIFGSNEKCKRSHFIIFLWRAEGSPNPGTNHSKFKDVKESQQCNKAVCWAEEKQIVKGNDQGGFAPNQPITRAEAVTLLYRCYG